MPAPQERISGSVLEYLDDHGNVIMSIDGAARSVSIPAGSSFVGAIPTADLAPAAVTKGKLAGGFSHVDIVAGVDETGTPSIAVTGIAVGDELVAVIVLASAASIATATKRANADFTIAADALTVAAHAANNAANQYLIFWN